ncbi:hypothetical protein PIB30_024053 [Stylosanthes scabra]|uniref:Secreted protein n=1 Tax=Stylosanthes scabra TaxID=79078 RepID=A0ABU6RA77_9FABA|nr:hypothetical protein [Stylosanthes scabra]
MLQFVMPMHPLFVCTLCPVSVDVAALWCLAIWLATSFPCLGVQVKPILLFESVMVWMSSRIVLQSLILRHIKGLSDC